MNGNSAYVLLKKKLSEVSSSIADTYNPLNIYEEGDFTIKDGRLCVYTGGVWVETKIVDNFGQGGDKDVFDFARFDGKRLNDVFADADALHAAIAEGDFSKIHVGDYWEITLNGTYRDYGVFMLPAGSKYYSDANCTDEVGTTDADANVAPRIEYRLLLFQGERNYPLLQNRRRDTALCGADALQFPTALRSRWH